MKAQNLTISLPNNGCDKNCPYCISKITGYCEADKELMEMNVNKVINIAKAAQITSVLFTSKGEPFFYGKKSEDDFFEFLLTEFDEFPIEIQTNGIKLEKQIKRSTFFESYIDIFSISIDSIEQLMSLKSLCTEINKINKTSRACINVSNLINPAVSFYDIFKMVKQIGFDQMTLRKIMYPTTIKNCNDLSKEQQKIINWIDNNASDEQYEALKVDAMIATQDRGILLRTLPYGAKVYDIEGIAVSYSDECIQETNNDNDIRSLIFMEDGHLYTSWNSKASRLF